SPAGHVCKSARGAVPPRGLQPVPVEPVLNRRYQGQKKRALRQSGAQFFVLLTDNCADTEASLKAIRIVI
ncbi:MAG TPA: hypothetical protein VLN58_11890, partial [Verrucomicrobiae bacterium]|nr:hypothetical protein [Verrucomicrobiae bacterium]